ncbi:hypothetical protein ACNJRE_13655, partial [Mycobacterium tuberculosis]
RISATIRTARSRSSGGYLLDEPPDMTPSFPRTGVSGHAGAVQPATGQGSSNWTPEGSHRAGLAAIRSYTARDISGPEF